MNENRSTGTPLARRLLLLGALPAIVMFVTLIGFFTSARLDDARQDLAASNQMLADTLAPSMEYAVVSGNTQVLQEILSQSLSHSQADWIRVKDVSGNNLGLVTHGTINEIGNPDDFEIYEAEILQQPLDFESSRESPWFEPDYSFGSGALRVGTVEIGVSDSVLVQRRHDIFWTSIAVGLSLLLLTVVIINHFFNAILSPIHRITGRISRLIAADYRATKVNRRRSSREFIGIEHQLNQLAEHLQSLKIARDQTLASSEQARQKAETANRAKSEFLATMSHELRTPLTGVLGMIDLIQEESLSYKQSDYLQTARHSTDDLLAVINDILDYSGLESGAALPEHQEFNLRTLILNCVASFRHIAQSQGLALTIDYLGDWPEDSLVKGDAPRIRQILASLLDNAIRFTGDGFVNIKAGYLEAEHDSVIFSCSVSDSGSGIPHERLPEMFNSFQQLDMRASRNFGGTGMGLSLVQRLVELLGGHVQVESDLGKGSSFRFEVPLDLVVLAEKPSAPELTTATPITAPPSAQALVVEDNPVNQRVAVALLKRFGFHVDAVSSGDAALENVKTNHEGYDVILMDCQMPIMDGYETTRYIREWEQSNGQSKTPIIALTADVLPGTERNCIESGMHDYLSKPVRKEKLRDILTQWIELPKSENSQS